MADQQIDYSKADFASQQREKKVAKLLETLDEMAKTGGEIPAMLAIKLLDAPDDWWREKLAKVAGVNPPSETTIALTIRRYALKARIQMAYFQNQE